LAPRLALYRRGLFGWPEGGGALSDATKRAQPAGDPDRGHPYYRPWLNALDRVVAETIGTDPAVLARYRDAWGHAAHRTPHGQPIELKAEDFR